MRLSAATQEMQSTGNTLMQQSVELNDTFKEVFNAIASLQNEWKGVDSSAYDKAVTAHQPNMNTLAKCVSDYGLLLFKAGQSFAGVQDNVQSAAQSLNK